MSFPSESLQLLHVSLHLVAPPPGNQTRCLPLLELSLLVHSSAGPGCRWYGGGALPPLPALLSPHLPAPIPALAARTPRYRISTPNERV